MKVVGIIQARTRSTRLPGKALREVCGKPLILHMLERVLRSLTLDAICLATSKEAADDPLASLGEAVGVSVFRGSESDVLDRFWRAARRENPDVVVRLTGDCPLHDPALIDEVIGAFLKRRGELDYLSNTLRRTYPDGLNVEVFSFGALDRAAKEATDPFHRIHVTPYIYQSGGERGGRAFRIGNHMGQADFSHLRWTVDEREDLEFVRKVFEALLPGKPDFSWQDVIALLTRTPAMLHLNPHLLANEGSDRDLARIQAEHEVSEKFADRPVRRFDRSNALFDRASRRIPLGSQAFSKSHVQYVRGASPLFLSHGKGGRVWDVDGNEYVDLMGGLLPIILGYQDPDVDASVRVQLSRGATFSLATEIEVDLAEELCRLIPCAEMVRYGENGSDASSAAVRLARAYTSRDHVAVCGYHGWHDSYIGSTARHKGVPDAVRRLTHPFLYNDLSSVERLFAEQPDQVAAVILEPAGEQEPAKGFLEGVRELTRRHGAVLIFDEIITGFRWHLGGAQTLYDVTPDLATFGKAMANGFPLSALVGRTELMRNLEDVFFSGTLGGEAISLVAGLATIRKLEREQVVNRLWERGGALREAVAQGIKQNELSSVLSVAGPPCWPVLQVRGGEGADEWDVRSFLRQELVQRGVLVLNSHNLCFAHTDEDMRRVLDAYDDVFCLLSDALQAGTVQSSLRGELVQPVFEVR